NFSILKFVDVEDNFICDEFFHSFEKGVTCEPYSQMAEDVIIFDISNKSKELRDNELSLATVEGDVGKVGIERGLDELFV
ncbi:11005_t:CDS:2, partial [Dentiscutata heterogama]